MVDIFEMQEKLTDVFVSAKEFGMKIFPNRLVECGIVPINGLNIVAIDLENQLQSVMAFPLTSELFHTPVEFFKKEFDKYLDLEETKRQSAEAIERIEAKKTLVRLAKYLNVYKEGMEDDIQN